MNNSVITLDDQDKKLFLYYLNSPSMAAAAGKATVDLGYPSVGAMNLHVIRLAKKLRYQFHYTPEIKDNGQKRWWPCLFEGQDSKNGFVWILRGNVAEWCKKLMGVDQFYVEVCKSLENREARLMRLSKAPKIPKKKTIQTWEFERNPDVVAEVLYRSKGICEVCGSKAPFLRKADKSPYLEVHHKKPLAFGGEDTVENAIAACPNCHRHAHYG